ncbi:MAG: aldo/keto reductase [Bacillus sp. (in: firmicutes)]
MKKRQLGESDLHVTEIGLGCMSLGTDEQKAKDIVMAALDAGINYFDTADLYDFGTNEELVGKALKDVRHDIILATKVGNKWNDNQDGWTWDASKAHIKEAVKNSLRRLQTDYIDLYQLHGGTMEDNQEETIEAFEELVQEGVVRYYGISSIRPNVIDSYLNKSNIVSVMMQYSLLDRRPEEYAGLLLEHQTSIIARGPVAKGILSDKMLAKASSTVKEKGFLDYSYQELDEVLGKLKEHFLTRSIQEVALQYVLATPEVSAVIPGASSIEQVMANAEAVNSPPLSEQEVRFLRDLTKANRYEQHRI